MLVAAALLGVIIAYGVWEYVRHQRNVRSIPIRVHVNGTRGKSSVTRLIAAGLRAGRIRTLAKTTGTKPRLICEDGSEVPIRRVGKANIIEQLMVFRRAVTHQVKAVVLECMAVQPSLQLLSERKMVRSTVGVLTNVRADHLDEMGPTLDAVARSLCNTVPRNGVLFTTERTFLPVILEQGGRQRCRIEPVTAAGVTDEMMKGFTYLEHKDNVALALAVCRHLGVEPDRALRGMQRSAPDPGVLRIFDLDYGTKRVEFVNAFAANDPDSYAVVWELLAPYRTPDKTGIVLVNARTDRIQRSEQLAAFIAGVEAERFVLVGSYTNALANRAVAAGLTRSRITDLGEQSAEQIFEQVVALTPSRSLVVGIGNIVGLGQEIVTQFANRGREIVY